MPMSATDYKLMASGILGLINPVAQKFPQSKMGLFGDLGTEGARVRAGGGAQTIGQSMPATNMQPIPKPIEAAWESYTRGGISAKDLQSIVKDHGWFLDLRSRRNEIFPPSGPAVPLD
jgi:hypothetical protein